MEFKQFWRIYESSFPEVERRSIKAQKILMQKVEYKIDPYYETGIITGFICYWELSNFIFIEHLAIKDGLRGRGYGRKMLSAFLLTHSGKENPPRIILEVELPTNSQSQRRIKFYENMGFYLNSYAYQQPPYRRGGEPIPLKLMSYCRPLSEHAFCQVQKEIYREVYGVSAP